MTEVGEERLDCPFVSELLAQVERLPLQPDGRVEIRAEARQLACGDPTLRLDVEVGPAGEGKRLRAPVVGPRVSPADAPVEPRRSEDPERGAAVMLLDRRRDRPFECRGMPAERGERTRLAQPQRRVP